MSADNPNNDGLKQRVVKPAEPANAQPAPTATNAQPTPTATNAQPASTKGRKKVNKMENIKKKYPIVNLIITIIMFAEWGIVYYFFSLKDSLTVLVFVALTAVALYLVRKFFHHAGIFISSFTATKALVEKESKRQKFVDQGWQLFIHFTMTIWNYIILDSVNWEWWNNPRSCWDNCHVLKPQDLSSCIDQPITNDVRIFYLVQLAIWAYTAFFHAFFDSPRKDYFVMYSHHIVTVGLVVLSYIFHYHRVGMLVLIIHDSSDIVMDVLKMLNYLEFELPTNITFVVNLFTWLWLRLYEFPFRIIDCTWRISLEVVGPLGQWWAPMNALLIILLLLHVYWYFLLIKMAFGLLVKPPKEVGKEEYEGTDEDA